jgi:hypothetical protein
MQVTQVILNDKNKASQNLQTLQAVQPDLLLVFGAIDWLPPVADTLAGLFPQAIRMGCSTAGEISTQGVSDNTCVVTAVRFERTRLVTSSTTLDDMADSLPAGQRLAQQLPQAGLRAVVVLGQGVAINGSALIEGLTSVLGQTTPITGGLAGDAAAFRETWVLDNTGVHNNHLVCLGLYGESLSFTHGSFGGWQPFGPARKVTRCANNVLYELDGAPALEVYKRYLGEHAKGLPASGLLFPFAMLGSDHTEVGVIRTILGVDETTGSLTLAGDIDPTGYLRLMHASTDGLVDGAEAAAQAANVSLQGPGQSLALLVSCVGRKLVMGGRVDEEVEAVGAVFGQRSVLTGFYSNGEISPLTAHTDCKLHNQTMTVTLLAEAAA